jgi:outer membrane protein OmpA-like peptidoglycan-associated protein
MSIYKVLSSLIVCSIISLPGYSQNAKQAKKFEKEADSYYQVEEYGDALKLYLKVDSLKKQDAKIQFRIGVCYMNSPTKIKSLPYLAKAKELDYKGKDLDLYLGKSNHLKNKFDEAIPYYKAYSETMKDSSRIVDLMNKYIEQCQYGKELVADSSQLIIENLGPSINSPFPDYVPVISADETVLIFTSRRPNTTGGKQDPADGLYYEDLYISYKQNGSWTIPVNMGDNVNSKLHDACIGLSPDGQKLFIYRARPGKRNSGDIFVSNLEGDKWSSPIAMSNPINSDSWEPSATITADEKTIYFSSDRPGGLGGTDIYCSKLQENGEWGEAVNLGPSINTPLDDDAPYIHPDGKTLYFSSKGHKTMGGFDIFSTVFDSEKNQWSEPKNAGYPINTADDDIYFVWSTDGSKGYFSSWRDDTYGDKDLYVIHGPKKGSPNLAILKGKVINGDDKQPVGATITLIDNNTHKTVNVSNSNSLTARYIVVLPHGKNYSVNVDAEGFMPYSDNVNVEKHDPFFESNKDVVLQPAKVGNHVVLENIFFDSTTANITVESTPEVNRILKFLTENPDLKVEIGGFKDDVGNDKINEMLTKERAANVVKLLLEKGVDKSRITSKGYGEQMPIASNSTAEGRKANERTELKITGGKSGPSIHETESTSMIAENRTVKQAETKVTETKHEPVKNEAHTSLTTTSGPMNFEMGYILKAKVHFTYNASEAMTEYSTERVNYVIELMKQNPNLKIRIRAHADHLGNKTYNKRLSERRAETVLNYMVKHGIDKNRLETKTFGDQQEIVTSDTKVGNLPNRRVEFEVIGL